jgi:3'-phosphoadenosine 5'-phosphosulfate sulfotransferase (PAPS reductase)/FAD synthetase
MDRKNVLMYGGGVQTVTIVALICNGELPKPERIIMADTGRERPAVFDYLEEMVKPRLAHIGLEVEIAGHELATVDLEAGNGDLLIPVFTETGKLPTFCSTEWKTRVCDRYLRMLGYGPKNPITAWFGMSLDEVGRMRSSRAKWKSNYYPLIENDATRMRRHECELYLTRHGWPVPPKSACWMCPQRDNATWQEMKDNEPDIWQKAVEFDKWLREPEQAKKWQNTYLHGQTVPLDMVDFSEPEKEDGLWGECAGSCWT